MTCDRSSEVSLDTVYDYTTDAVEANRPAFDTNRHTKPPERVQQQALQAVCGL